MPLRLAPPDGAFVLYEGRLRPCAFSSNAGPLFINRIRFALRYGIDLIRFQRGIGCHLKMFNKCVLFVANHT